MIFIRPEDWDKLISLPDQLMYLSGQSFHVPKNELCYETTYDACGVVGAEMASLLLCGIMEAPVLSGFLSIISTYISGDAQLHILSQILGNFEASQLLLPSQFYIDASDNKLLALIAWCMSCGWRFVFLADKQRFGIQGVNDETVRISWNAKQSIQKVVPTLLKNLDFQESVNEL